MSNIIVHTTPQLLSETSFVNTFLDGLLESYCKKKFQPNTVFLEGIPNITIETLLKEANPGFYLKAPGLLADYTSTKVIVVYDENIHDILVEALEHKLSILFLNIDLSICQLNEVYHNFDTYFIVDGFVLKVISCPRKNHLAFRKQSIILNSLNENVKTLWKQNLNSLIY